MINWKEKMTLLCLPLVLGKVLAGHKTHPGRDIP